MNKLQSTSSADNIWLIEAIKLSISSIFIKILFVFLIFFYEHNFFSPQKILDIFKRRKHRNNQKALQTFSCTNQPRQGICNSTVSWYSHPEHQKRRFCSWSLCQRNSQWSQESRVHTTSGSSKLPNHIWRLCLHSSSGNWHQLRIHHQTLHLQTFTTTRWHRRSSTGSSSSRTWQGQTLVQEAARRSTRLDLDTSSRLDGHHPCLLSSGNLNYDLYCSHYHYLDWVLAVQKEQICRILQQNRTEIWQRQRQSLTTDSVSPCIALIFDTKKVN